MHARLTRQPSAAYLRQDETLFQGIVAVVARASTRVRSGQQRLHTRVLGQLPTAPPPHEQARKQQRCRAVAAELVCQPRLWCVVPGSDAWPAHAAHGLWGVSTSRQRAQLCCRPLAACDSQVWHRSTPSSARPMAAITTPTMPPVLRPPPPLVLHAAEVLMLGCCCGRLQAMCL